jgi:hypothetical protein
MLFDALNIYTTSRKIIQCIVIGLFIYSPENGFACEGIKFGRKRKIDREKVIALRANGIGATEISKQAKIGRSTVYKLLKEAEAIQSNLIFSLDN